MYGEFGKNKIHTVIATTSDSLLLILKITKKLLIKNGIQARNKFQLRNKNTFVSLM
jgi:hypothetical protein